MSEICLDCLNRICQTEYEPWRYVLSDELDLCEECGQWKRVVVRERNLYFLRRLGLDAFLALRCSLEEKHRR